MRVLVTGGGGFIGSHVAEYYAKQRENVTVIDNLSRSKTFQMNQKAMAYNWNYLRSNYLNIKLINGDIRDFETVQKVTKDTDVIVHLAGQVAVTTAINDPKTDFEINAVGTFNLLEGARNSKTDPTFIYCSTNKVYGMNVNQIPVKEGKTRYYFSDQRYQKGIPEDFPVDLCEHTPYGCSKLVGDLYVQDYAHVYGLKTAVFRMSCIYGERQFGVEEQGWIAVHHSHPLGEANNHLR
jgi:CDP-paratose 2-epimerase